MTSVNPFAAALADAQKDRYAPPSTFVAEIDEIKHGINNQTKEQYSLFVLRVLEVSDNKLPRPEVNADQEPLEPGEIVTLYKDQKYESGRVMIKEALAAVVGAKLGRDVKPVHLKADASKSDDPEACTTYLDGFDVLDAKGNLKVSRRDFFNGVRVVVDVTNDTDKDGNPKKFTSFTMTRAA